MAAMPDDASARMSTTVMSGVEASVLVFDSRMPIGTPPARSSCDAWRLNSSSCVMIETVNCAIAVHRLYRPGGLRPAGPPIAVARGAPAPLRSGGRAVARLHTY